MSCVALVMQGPVPNLSPSGAGFCVWDKGVAASPTAAPVVFSGDEWRSPSIPFITIQEERRNI